MILAIDFDGTIVFNRYPEIGDLIPGAAENIQKLVADGHIIIIWTCREGEQLDAAIEFLNANEIPYDHINANTPENIEEHNNDSRKVFAHVYIDDQNVKGIPDWDEIYKLISEKDIKTLDMTIPKNTFGQVRTFDPATVEETRTIPFVFSTASRDGHGTVLNQENWNLERFNGNGIAGYMHNVYGGDLCSAPDPDDVIGSARSWVEDGQLVGEIKFEPKEINEKAEKIFRKVLAGTLKAVSVGFMPIGQGHWGEGDEGERGTNPTYYYEGQELLEISVVNIPSNPDALRRSARNNVATAIAFVHRQLNEKQTLSFAEIEAMTVGEVIRLMDGKAEGRQQSPEKPPGGTPPTQQMKRRAKYLEHLNNNS